MGLTVFQIFWSTGLAFIPCELGERTSGTFVEICDEIDNFDWYAFPMKIQKILPLILINAQEPVAIECFGSIACARDVFKRVSKTQIIDCFKRIN